MTNVRDTSPEAERVLVRIFRAMTAGQKWHRLGDLYRTAKVLHASGVRYRNPAATGREIHQAWIAVTHGQSNASDCGSGSMESIDDNLNVVRDVTSAFTRLDIAYALGGSMASSMLGTPRFTNDADLTCDPFPGKEAAFAECFGAGYFVSLAAIQEALSLRSSFNIIHSTSGFKVDVFVRKDRAFEASVMARRQTVPLANRPEDTIVLVSPEDIVLLKLEWFRLGNEISDRQWHDILGVLKVQAGRLDESYMDYWAGVLQVRDLLTRARQEVSLSSS